MKIKNFPLSWLLSIVGVIACSAPARPAIAMQITFVESTQSRNQTQTQAQPQVQPQVQSRAQSQARSQARPQEGLSPEKKKSLSKYGPEDIFPAGAEQESAQGRNSPQPQPPQSAPTSKYRS